MNNKRLERIVENMKRHELSQMLITSTPGIFYLTGKWIEPGERLLAMYINDKGYVGLVMNDLFKARSDIEGAEVVLYNDDTDPIPFVSKLIQKGKPIGVDKDWPSHFLIELLEREGNLKPVNSSPVIDEVRMVKDDEEIKLMKESSYIADQVISEAQKHMGEGLTEKQLSKIVSESFERHGVLKLSFETIVGYGGNGADPHHGVDDSLPKEGDSIVLDMGGAYKHYCSDITRTFFYGKPSTKAENIYNIVLEANLKAISIIKPGVTFAEIDNAARGVIEKAGYGQLFTHRTGHNIGIEDHEYPSVSSTNNMPVVPGMTFSIEPGIYVPGEVGVRIEDLVVVTENGVEVMNKYPKELTIVK